MMEEPFVTDDELTDALMDMVLRERGCIHLEVHVALRRRLTHAEHKILRRVAAAIIRRIARDPEWLAHAVRPLLRGPILPVPPEMLIRDEPERLDRQYGD